jgi:mono/diheme cytochrome c family protein
MRRAAVLALHFVALAVALALSACDRAPSPSGLPEWTPADHEQAPGKESGAAGDQAGKPSRGAKGSAGGSAVVEATWRQQCATCHGPAGRGDGPQGPMFRAPDLGQSKASDDEIAAVIREGKGRMPKFDLPDDVVRGLVSRVRSFRAP